MTRLWHLFMLAVLSVAHGISLGLQMAVNMGKGLKGLRANGGEQFCVFAFDLGAREIVPKPSEVKRASLPMCTKRDGFDWTWDAAFYGMTARNHTEKVLLQNMLDWASGYRTFNQGQNPKKLFIYSFLIPCECDGEFGMCAENLEKNILRLHKFFNLEEVYISWSNDGPKPGDTACANIRFKTLKDSKLLKVVEYGKVSIAG